MKENEITLFEANDNSVSLPVAMDGETVWLSANQMAILFERDEKTIRKHINNALQEEVDRSNNTQKMRVVGVKQLYKECKAIIMQMKYVEESNLFGNEKDGSLQGVFCLLE